MTSPDGSQPNPTSEVDSEDATARACRAYHERNVPSLHLRGRREALADFAVGFYEKRLRIPLTEGQRETIGGIAEADTLLLQVAHDGQLPHLGIIRMALKALDVAQRDGRAVTLYLIGNHYTPAMRPDNIWFGMPLKGESPDAVKHPPKLRIGKANANVPFRWLPPPKLEDLNTLRVRVEAFVAHNLAHERKRGTYLAPGSKETIDARLNALFHGLRTAANEVQSLGDWLIRVQHDLFHVMLGDEAARVVLLPMAELTALLRGELAQLALANGTVSRIKATVSQEQLERGEEPYQTSQTRTEPSSFWMYCPSCHRRQRTPWLPGSRSAFICASCGHSAELEEPAIWQWLMPDIVAYEAALFRLGIDGWITGSRAAYHPVIERVYTQVFGAGIPPRFFLTSVPTFFGLGDAPGGCRRTRLTRALLEMRPEAIAQALRAPWNEDPRLVSDLLA